MHSWKLPRQGATTDHTGIGFLTLGQSEFFLDIEPPPEAIIIPTECPYAALTFAAGQHRVRRPVSELLGRYGLEPADLNLHLPPSAGSLANSDLQVHYLGHFLRWRPQLASYYAVEHGGFEASPERTPGTYSKYNSIDDLHYWTTCIKFGLGRTSYDAAQEIRSGEITREEGVALVKRFDGEWPAHFEPELMDYLTIDDSLGAAASQFPIRSWIRNGSYLSPTSSDHRTCGNEPMGSGS